MDHEIRVLITGVDVNGRSCVVGDERVPLEAAPDAGVWFAVAHATASAPPPTRPEGRADHMDVSVPPGIVRWMVIDYGPDQAVATHHTDTVDFDLVLSGSIDLTLDDGTHHLRAGDGVIVNGVDHGWRSGPDGCRLNVMFVGTPPR